MQKYIYSGMAAMLALAMPGCGSGSDGDAADQDGDGYSAPADCNDGSAAVNPGALEACDGLDNNCDGQVDEGFTTTAFYPDGDGDGYGVTASGQTGCVAPTNYVTQGGDCNDSDLSIHPSQSEQLCNGVDENCSGTDDDHPDTDSDGFDKCDPGVSGADGFAVDCNDSSATQNPGAAESCNGTDDNCNGQIDEGLPLTTYYLDWDADGYGDDATTADACTLPAGYAAVGGDCDDQVATTYPDAPEVIGDGLDSDCNGYSDWIFAYAGTGDAGYSGDGEDGSMATFNHPAAVGIDLQGNVFIADTLNHCIRERTLEGLIVTIAGTGEPGYSEDGALGTEAMLQGPSAVATDATGNVYIADTLNNRIRKIDISGIITTVAGTGDAGDSGDNWSATSAMLNAPTGVATDVVGNLYIADTGNNRVRKVNKDGTISAMAGTGSADFSGDNGPATQASLNAPRGLATDANGTLYVADSGNHVVRKINPASGNIVTVAGRGELPGYGGDNGPATAAKLNYPTAIFVSPTADLFIADSLNNRIRVVTTAEKKILTIAGNGTASSTGDDGPGYQATVNNAQGVVLDTDGNLIIADTDNNRLRKIVW